MLYTFCESTLSLYFPHILQTPNLKFPTFPYLHGLVLWWPQVSCRLQPRSWCQLHICYLCLEGTALLNTPSKPLVFNITLFPSKGDIIALQLERVKRRKKGHLWSFAKQSQVLNSELSFTACMFHTQTRWNWQKQETKAKSQQIQHF